MILPSVVGVVGKNPNTPNLNPMAMADDAITRGGIRGMGSPLYICVFHTVTWSRHSIAKTSVFAIEILNGKYHVILHLKI